MLQGPHFKFLFSREYNPELIEKFSKVILEIINHDINQQLIERYELAKSNYFTEVSYIKKNLTTLISNLENDYQIYLELLINLKKPAGTSNKKLWWEYPASNKQTL